MTRNLSLQKVTLFSALTLVVAAAFLGGCTPRDRFGGFNTSIPGKTATPGQAPAETTFAAPVQARPAKVALLVPLSGKGSDTGQAMLNAAQLAVFDLNASTFELIPRDTAGTAEGARDAAIAAANSGAEMVIGPLFAHEAKAVTPVALQRGLSTISFSTDTSVAGTGGFVLGFLPQTQVRQVIDFALTQRLQRIALIAPQNAYGDIAAQTFALYGGPALIKAGVLRYDPAAGVSVEQLKAFVAANALPGRTTPFDAVLIAAPGTQSATISQSLNLIGLPSSVVARLGTGLWDQPDVARLPALQGAYYAASSPRLRERFEERYLHTYGEPAPRLASLGYDATALGIVLARGNQPYSRQTLTNPNGFAGIDGIFRFRNDGLVERGLAILQIRDGAALLVRDAPSSFQSGG